MKREMVRETVKRERIGEMALVIYVALALVFVAVGMAYMLSSSTTLPDNLVKIEVSEKIDKTKGRNFVRRPITITPRGGGRYD